jgi:acetyl-CoA decarbonylase/synthase complex subunit gamma
MAITALDIYKLLPKTNCKKCGFPTCLAFAMSLAQGRVSLEKCPDIAEEGQATLSETTTPPVKTIYCGFKDRPLEIGGEEVLFRHEKTFHHTPLFAVTLSDTLPVKQFVAKVKEIREMEFKRVGQVLKIDLLAVKNDSLDADTFVQYVQLTADLPLILISADWGAIKQAHDFLQGQTPILIGKCTKDWIQTTMEIGAVLAIQGDSLDEIVQKSQAALSQGLENLILYPRVKNLRHAVTFFSQLRMTALRRESPPLRFPLLGWAGHDLVLAGNMICKYAGVIILDTMDFQKLLPLITLRLNIYTDPRHPQIMEPKLYKVGQPDEHSPIIVTTNFSLTFHTVQSEIENSKVPSYLLVTDSEGLSVQTAYAADKFNEKTITNAIRNSGMEEKVRHRKVIIPGYAAILKAPLEEESGWEVIVGPKESNGIPKFLRKFS